MARNPAQLMYSYGVAANSVVLANTAAALPASTSYLPSITSTYVRPPGDIRNARAYAHWLAHGGRKKLHHQRSLSGPMSGHGHHGHGRRFRGRGFRGGYGPYYQDPTVCFVNPETGLTTCAPASSGPFVFGSPGGFGAPGGFRIAQIGSSTRPTAGFHDYGYADAFGVLDPAQLLEANEAAESGTKGSQDLAETLKALSPAITTVVESVSDPYKRVQILEAKIKKAKRSGASASKLERLYAKLDAAKHRLSIKDEALDSTRDWRMLGKAGIVTGIGVGAAIIFFIMMQSFKPRKMVAA